MNRSTNLKPEQDYALLLEQTTSSPVNPFGKSAVKSVTAPVITKTILRSISPQEATIVVQEMARLLDAFSGQEYSELLRYVLVKVQETKKLRKRFSVDNLSAILLLIESFSRVGQTFEMRKKGGHTL
ncbi:hypothetical protein GCM10027299_42030 [Larkinella ripae]